MTGWVEINLLVLDPSIIKQCMIVDLRDNYRNHSVFYKLKLTHKSLLAKSVKLQQYPKDSRPSDLGDPL